MNAGIPGVTTSTPGDQSARSRADHLWSVWHKQIFGLGDDRIFLLLAVVIGAFSGLSVVCFRIAIDWTRLMVLGSNLYPPPLRVLLAPAIAGLLVALLVLFIFPNARGSGVNQTKAAMYIFNGYVSLRAVLGKFLTCAISIGSGFSLGPEDPSLHIGAGIASLLGRKLKLSREKSRLLAPIGAAAGLAAAFNAPVSAVIFVIEEIIGTWSGGVLGAIILAAVSSVVVMRTFLGSQALFRVPRFSVQHASELLAYVALGAVGGLASLALLKTIAYFRPRFQRLPRWTHVIQPAAAGLLIGVIGIWLPQVMGAGYPFMDQALHGDYAWKMLLLLALFKILATSLSFVSGTPGGMFAPTLFIGAMLGGAVGGIEQHFFHHLSGSVASFALVGMGTLFAGFLRVPITSVFMVIEITGDYSTILPVLVSNMLAYLISRRFQETPLFDLLSRQDGLVLPSLEELRERRILRVEDALRPAAGLEVHPHELVPEALARIADSADSYCLVPRHGRGWSLLAIDDLRLRAQQQNSQPVSSVTSRPGVEARISISAPIPTIATLRVADLPLQGPLPSVHPDQTLEDALRQLGDWPFLPVASRVNPQKLEGIIGMDDILRAYREM